MLTRRQRLIHGNDFNRVYRYGRSASGAWLTIRVNYGEKGRTRFGVVVPNAVVRRAVDRNRIRRQLRALIAEKYLTFPGGYDCVLQVRATPPRSMEELKRQFIFVRERLNRTT